jgi:hypothetical protein
MVRATVRGMVQKLTLFTLLVCSVHANDLTINLKLRTDHKARLESEKMTKFRLDFEADEWLSAELEAYQNKHPELDFKKDVLQGYVLDLKAQVQYLRDMAEKSFEGSSASSVRQDSPPYEQKTSTTQEPIANLALPALTKQPLFRPPDTSVEWKDGKQTFTAKKEEALAFAKRLLELKNEKQRELEQIKTDGARERAEIRSRRRGSQDGRTGEIIDATPWGAPVDEYIR